MPLIKIQTYPGMRQVFIAAEDISHLAVIAYSDKGIRRVAPGTNAKQAEVCGVAYGSVSGAVSGKILRAVTHGIVSGLICAIAVDAGDRVACASAGKIAPLNTVSPIVSASITLNLISGSVGGEVSVQTTPAGVLGWTSGLASGLTGMQFSSGKLEPFDTARILGKALTSGAIGAGIPVLVTLGG